MVIYVGEIPVCLIIVKPESEHVTRKDLRDGYAQNPDGSGFMYCQDNQVKIQKGFSSFKLFYVALRKTEKTCSDSNFVIHFRLSTSGKRNEQNTHPFFVRRNKIGFVHNGILSGKGSKKHSDTKQYNNFVLKNLPDNFLGNPSIMWLIENYAVKEHSKFVFLDGSGEYKIMNETAGHWDDGCWFSSDGLFDYMENCTWSECDACDGYFPVSEMILDTDGSLICEVCAEYLEIKL